MCIDHADLLEGSGKYDEEEECLKPTPYVVPNQPLEKLERTVTAKDTLQKLGKSKRRSASTNF